MHWIEWLLFLCRLVLEGRKGRLVRGGMGAWLDVEGQIQEVHMTEDIGNEAGGTDSSVCISQ